MDVRGCNRDTLESLADEVLQELENMWLPLGLFPSAKERYGDSLTRFKVGLRWEDNGDAFKDLVHAAFWLGYSRGGAGE